jgi:hypothetical protein
MRSSMRGTTSGSRIISICRYKHRRLALQKLWLGITKRLDNGYGFHSFASTTYLQRDAHYVHQVPLDLIYIGSRMLGRKKRKEKPWNLRWTSTQIMYLDKPSLDFFWNRASICLPCLLSTPKDLWSALLIRPNLMDQLLPVASKSYGPTTSGGIEI